MNQKGINYIIWILKLIGICLLMPFSQTFQKWLIGENFTANPQLEISLNFFILGIMILLLAYCFAVSSYKSVSKKRELKIRGEKND
jgi:uncharacterized BrkB/YihY/UPF0761 family membrane protein